MRKRELLVDVDYAVRGDPRTPHRLVRLKDPDQPQRVVTRVGDHYVSIHPSHIKARWDDPEQVAAREREDKRTARHREAIDLAERLGFAVARDGGGWEAHSKAEARLTLSHPWTWKPGRDALAMDIRVDLDAWLRIAPELVAALALVTENARTRAIVLEQAERDQHQANLQASREGRR